MPSQRNIYPHRKLLEALIAWANSGDTKGLPTHTTRWRGLPVLHIPVNVTWSALSDGKCDAKHLLTLAAHGLEYYHDIAQAEINRIGMGVTLFDAPPGGMKRRGIRSVVPVLALRVTSQRQIPYAIMALAYTTKLESRRGGRVSVLADLIAKCERCGKFFLLKTIRPSKHCGKRCRFAAWKSDTSD